MKILSILYVPVLLAILGEEGNGVYAASYQVYVLVYVITNTGIPIAISKLVSELSALDRQRDALRSFRIARALLILAGAITALLMFLTAKPMADALNFSKARMAIIALSPSLLFTSVASAYRGYFQGKGNMVPTALSQVLEQVVHMVFTVVFAAVFMKYGLEAACAGGAAGTSIGALFSVGFLAIYFSKYLNIDSNLQNTAGVTACVTGNKDPGAGATCGGSYRQLTGRLLQYGIPITLCMGLQYAGNLADLWNTKTRLLAAGFSDEAASVLYNYLYKYQQLMNAPISVVSALSAVVLPAVAAATVIRNRELIEKRIHYAFRLCMIIVIPSAAGLALLAKPVFETLRFGGGSYIMAYGSPVLILLSLVQIQTVILQASGKLYTATVNLVSGIMLKITINYFLIAIPGINVAGAVIGSLAGYLLPVTLNFILINKKLHIRSRAAESAFKPLLSAAVMSVCAAFLYTAMVRVSDLFSRGRSGYWMTVIITVITIISGIIVYFYTMTITGGFTVFDIQALPEKARRIIPGHVYTLIKGSGDYPGAGASRSGRH